MLAKVIFWASLGFILYTYIGYPTILYIWAMIGRRPVYKKPFEPTVSIIIAVYNEEKYIEDKIRNILNLEYPENKFEIIIISDGSEDGTNKIIGAYKSSRVRIFNYQGRKGKAYALNIGIKEAKGEILFFTDARQGIKLDSLTELTANFSDPSVGVVTGELILRGETKNIVSKGIGLYWQIEKWMRKKEGEIHSVLGATGCIYACRKYLIRPIRPEIILDDVMIPFQCILKGFRCVFESGAIAFDDTSEEIQKEFKRKVRTLSGNYQLINFEPKLMDPLKNPVFFQFISHKISRLLVPFAMTVFLFSNLFIYEGFYLVILLVQSLFYLSAILANWGPDNFIGKAMKIANTLFIMNLAALVGCYEFIRRPRAINWEKV